MTQTALDLASAGERNPPASASYPYKRTPADDHMEEVRFRSAVRDLIARGWEPELLSAIYGVSVDSLA
jgi:hypothetical protein